MLVIPTTIYQTFKFCADRVFSDRIVSFDLSKFTCLFCVGGRMKTTRYPALNPSRKRTVKTFRLLMVSGRVIRFGC